MRSANDAIPRRGFSSSQLTENGLPAWARSGKRRRARKGEHGEQHPHRPGCCLTVWLARGAAELDHDGEQRDRQRRQLEAPHEAVFRFGCARSQNQEGHQDRARDRPDSATPGWRHLDCIDGDPDEERRCEHPPESESGQERIA